MLNKKINRNKDMQNKITTLTKRMQIKHNKHTREKRN